MVGIASQDAAKIVIRVDELIMYGMSAANKKSRTLPVSLSGRRQSILKNVCRY